MKRLVFFALVAIPASAIAQKPLPAPTQHILWEKGTERAFSGEFWNHFETGVYCCINCGDTLFTSEAKFESRCGWPSFDTPADALITAEDLSHGMRRIEVMCPSCGGHLGHVFNDGPTATGLRYCINSAVLDFAPADSAQKKGAEAP